MRLFLIILGVVLPMILLPSELTLAQAPKLPCATQQVVEGALARQPELRENQRRAQAELRQKAQARAQGRVASNDSVRVIPIVFHIFHNNGPENLTDRQIQDILLILNRDFQLRQPDTARVQRVFRPVMGNTRLEFRLARRDPQGNCTNGITRHQSLITYAANENMKDVVSWDTDKYVNCWIGARIDLGGFLVGGYAYYPGTAPAPRYEGVVVAANQMGFIGGSTTLAYRTLTHEIGHYLNLAHTWGSTNEPGVAANCQTDDDVQDTPNCIGVSTGGCPLTQATCGPLANVENFMDYSSCDRMFTQGQSDRMRDALQSTMGSRNNLWTPENLIATGVAQASPALCAPKVQVASTLRNICPGQTVQLLGSIANVPQDTGLQLRWSIPGAVPATSTERNPVVTFPTEGLYVARLLARNSAGADSAALPYSIFVAGNQRAYAAAQAEDFEAPAWPQAGSNSYNRWQADTAESAAFWRRSTQAGWQSPSALQGPADLLQPGERLGIASAGYDLSQASPDAVLQYKYAAAAQTPTDADRLRLLVSTNCGRNYALRILRQGNTGPGAMYTTSRLASPNWRPSTTEWRTERISLQGVAGQADVRFRFELEGGGGAGVYIDSLVVLVSRLTAVATAEARSTLRVSPNPVQGSATVQLPASGLAYRVVNTVGQVVASGMAPSTQLVLDTQAWPAGAYVVSVGGATHMGSCRFVVAHLGQ